MSKSPVRVVFLMADYGHDPTETAIPYSEFISAGYKVTIATQHGAVPACDSRMLTGWTQTFLGADNNAISHYDTMIASDAWQHPRSYTDPIFTLESYDLVFLPGGHDKGIRQLLDDPHAHKHLVSYFPLTRRSVKTPLNSRPKFCAAVCHGVQLLAQARNAEGISVLRDVETTALPDFFESSVYGATKLFLGDYYKTYGAESDNVAAIVRKSLADEAQFKWSNNVATPFVVEDSKYRYFSGRWPGDAKLLAEKLIQAIGA